jgi:hypothetical protein
MFMRFFPYMTLSWDFPAPAEKPAAVKDPPTDTDDVEMESGEEAEDDEEDTEGAEEEAHELPPEETDEVDDDEADSLSEDSSLDEGSNRAEDEMVDVEHKDELAEAWEDCIDDG